MRSLLSRLALPCLLLAGCACETSPTRDAAVTPDAFVATDARTDDAGIDTGEGIDVGNDAPLTPDAPSCLVSHMAGERYPLADDCNFCECGADGVETCTERTCAPPFTTCELEGRSYDYGETFDLGDGCNECVCAPSGIACTRRTCEGAREEGAILLEDLNEGCGPREGFTAGNVLAELPFDTIEAPFLYERMRATYPETRADTTLSLRIAYAGGFAVCRLETEDRAAIDMEVVLEWQTADGAFDEGIHAYLRKNDFGFLDAWFVLSTLPVGSIEGTYTPACPLPRDLSFSAQIERTGAASGSVNKTCEADIGLTVGSFAVAP